MLISYYSNLSCVCIFEKLHLFLEWQCARHTYQWMLTHLSLVCCPHYTQCVVHTIPSVLSTLYQVCFPHYTKCVVNTIPSVFNTLDLVVCYAHLKECAYRDICSTPYLVCCSHLSFYSASPVPFSFILYSSGHGGLSF